MIRIERPAAVPSVLTTRGTSRRDRMVRDYDASPAEYDARTVSFTFDSGIYGHQAVKRALVDAQHGKCCFCESKTGMDGDVEHYRPKAGFSQGDGAPIEGPGYYWLAYEWENLLLACSICNQRFKRNLFPLADPAKRARSHKADVALEDPLFINPCETDPERLISFRREIPYAIDGNPYGATTIRALQLDREILNERRRDRLEMLKTLHELVMMESEATPELVPLIDKAKRLLAEAVENSAEFASMARVAARSGWYVEN